MERGMEPRTRPKETSKENHTRERHCHWKEDSSVRENEWRHITMEHRGLEDLKSKPNLDRRLLAESVFRGLLLQCSLSVVPLAVLHENLDFGRPRTGWLR